MNPLRTVFMGTAPIACPSLVELGAAPFIHLAAVVTQPDRPKGRDLRLQPPAVKVEAQRLRLPVLQPARARDPQFMQALANLSLDLIVVAAYGQILPAQILELPRHGCINVHASLLPKYRGAAPIQWAILDGETETGVTIMKMDAGLDTGDILTQATTPIRSIDTAESLHDRLAGMGAELLLKTIPDYVAGKLSPQPQPATAASYARKLSKEDGRLDWTRHAQTLRNQVRALTPWPGAFAVLPKETGDGRIKVWEAEAEELSGEPGTVLRADKSGILVGCGSGSLRILTLQPEGGKRLKAGDYLLGHRLEVGASLLLT